MMVWWKLLRSISRVRSNWWIFDSSMILPLHIVICGNLSYFRNFRRHISLMVNSSFRKVSQTSIPVSIFCGLSYLADVRISCLVFLYILSFRCYAGPFIGWSNISTSFTFRDCIRRLGRLLHSDIFYLFIQALDYWDELNSLRVSSNWLSNSAHFRQLWSLLSTGWQILCGEFCFRDTTNRHFDPAYLSQDSIFAMTWCVSLTHVIVAFAITKDHEHAHQTRLPAWKMELLNTYSR